MKKIPKLRFKEFSEEWEEKKLEKIFEIFNGYAFSSKENVKKGIILLKIANIGITKLNKNDISFLPINFLDLYSKFLLKKGDIVIALTRPLLNGKLKIAEINEYFNNCLLNQRVGKILTKENKKFIYNMLQNKNYIKKIENNISGSDPPNLSTESIKDINITIPILQEQEKIADFLSSVDVKINLTENKLELLKKKKKGIMQKIFSQELRFKDSNGNAYPKWEEKKFNEVFSFLQNNTFSRECLTTEKQEVQNIHYGDILTKYNNILKITNDIPYIKKEYNLSKFSEESFLKTGDIIIADTAEDFTVGKAIEISNTKKKKVLSGLHTFACRTNFNFAFGYLGQYLNSNQYHLQLYFFVTGIKVSSISKHSIKDTKLFFPKNEKEQKKIADFLSSIDTKIEKLSDELENLKEFKKGLLQQMFV